MRKYLLFLLLIVFILSGSKLSAGITVENNILEANTESECTWYFDGKEVETEITSNKLEIKQSGIYSVEYINAEGIKRSQQVSVLVYDGKIITIHLIGDSTMATYSADRYPLTGWGQVFQGQMQSDSLKKIKYIMDADSVVVINYARGGRSSRTFYEEGLWDDVYAALDSGDYVFIQFGHNDASIDNPDRYVDTAGFKDYLRLYVNQTREKGGIPVLITPVNRNYNWVGGVLTNIHGNYPIAMKQVAEELHVPLIDLTQRSCDYFTLFGENYCKYNFFMNFDAGVYENYPDGNSDGTHFLPAGAKAVAKMVYNGLVDLRNIVIDSVPDTVGVVKGSKWWEYKYDSLAELSTSPKRGYVFSSWEGDINSTDNPVYVKIDSCLSLKANFTKTTKNQYYVTAENDANGTIKINPFGGLYEEDETVTVSAVANSGKKFYSWIGQIVDTTNPLDITVKKDLQMKAFFTEERANILEAEFANFIKLPVSKTNNLYTGEGYASAADGADSLIWNVFPPESSKYYLKFRYCGNITTDFYTLVYVNGELEDDEYKFTATDNDTTWKYTSSIGFKIDPGKNTIKLVFPALSGTVNIDHMKLTGNPLLAPSVDIKNISSDKAFSVTMFPNPAESFTSISLNAINETFVNIELLSVNGSRVATIYNGKLSKGLNEFKLNTELYKGYYILKVVGDDSAIYQKLIVR